MTKEEFAKIAMAMRSYYPKENLLPTNQSMTLWFAQLEDLDYQLTQAALAKWVTTNKWSPSIAEIREMATDITTGDVPDWSEAWESVRRAMRNFGSYRPTEALASMDDLTRTVVNRLGFRNLCLSENYEVDRANFRMIYEQLAQRKRREALLPPKLKAIMQQLRAPAIEGGEPQ